MILQHPVWSETSDGDTYGRHCCCCGNGWRRPGVAAQPNDRSARCRGYRETCSVVRGPRTRSGDSSAFTAPHAVDATHDTRPLPAYVSPFEVSRTGAPEASRTMRGLGRGGELDVRAGNTCNAGVARTAVVDDNRPLGASPHPQRAQLHVPTLTPDFREEYLSSYAATAAGSLTPPPR